jgi:hypothetical protein
MSTCRDVIQTVYLTKQNVLPVRYTNAGGHPWKHRVTEADNLCFGVFGWLALIYGH